MTPPPMMATSVDLSIARLTFDKRNPSLSSRQNSRDTTGLYPCCFPVTRYGVSYACLFRAWHLHIDAVATATLSGFHDTQARDGAFEGALQFGALDVALSLRQQFLGAAASGGGTGLVDLLGAFRRVGQNGNVVVAHLQEAAGDEDGFFARAELDAQLAGLERGQQGGVFRQDAETPFAARRAHQIGLPVVEFAVGCDNPDIQDVAIACRHRLDPRLLLRFEALIDLIDAAGHVEERLRHLIELAIKNLAEAANRLFQRHVLAFASGERLGHREGLREETLNLAGARHRQLVLVREFVDAQDGNDILQVFVSLKHLLHAAGDVVVFLTNDLRIQDTADRK